MEYVYAYRTKQTKTDMSSDTNNQDGGVTDTNDTQGATAADTVALSKSEYEELIGVKSSYGSLKREFKDLKKSLEERQTEALKETKSDTSVVERLEKTILRSAQITAEDEVDLARSTAKKWGTDIESLLDDPDFQVKLKRLRDTKANELATSNIKGGQGVGQAKMTAEYWLSKGTPPTAAEVPDRKTRAAIARAFIGQGQTNGKRFYND